MNLNPGRSFTGMYVKKRKEKRKNIPTIRDSNRRRITDPVEKASNLNTCYASVVSYERDIQEIKISHMYEIFTIRISIIRKRLAMIGRNNPVRSNDMPGDILKMGGEAMISYLARLPDLSIKNVTILEDWEKKLFFSI
jgi:hypothetical protein